MQNARFRLSLDVFYISVILPPEGRGALRLFARPASLGEDQTPLIGGAAKRACQLESLVAFGSGRHLARKLQRVCRRDLPIHPITLG